MARLALLQRKDSLKQSPKRKLKPTKTTHVLEFNPFDKHLIRDVGRQGQQAFDDLGRLYFTERQRQQQELRDKMREREGLRMELLEEKEKRRQAEEEREIRLMQEKLERERVAKEQLVVLRTQLRERRKFLYHGGFS